MHSQTHGHPTQYQNCTNVILTFINITITGQKFGIIEIFFNVFERSVSPRLHYWPKNN